MGSFALFKHRRTGLQSFNTVRGMKMPSNLKNYEPLLVRKDIAELAELGAALMPGSMTLAPLNASVGFGQLMIYLRSGTVLSCKPFPH